MTLIMNHEKFHGNRSARFWEIRKTDTDGQTRQLYVYRSELDYHLREFLFVNSVCSSAAVRKMQQ